MSVAQRAREHRGKLLLAGAVAVVAVLYFAGVFPELPNVEKLIEDVARTLGPWTYALVAAAAFLETGAFVGLIAPGETTVIVGGVIAGQGEIELVPLIGLVWLSCVLGDITSFFIGRRLGRGFLERHGPKMKIDEQRLQKVESYFERHGGKTILVGRFIGLVRALSPFVAGSSGLAFGRFIPFSVIGCGLWASLFSVLGYVFWQSFDRVTAVAGQATLAFGLTVAVVGGGVYAFRRLRKAQERRRLAAWARRQGERPALRPLVRLVSPAWRRVARPVAAAAAPRLRFLRDRLTPGELGLEFTTAVAVGAAGLYVFAFYTAVIDGGRRSTPADAELLDLSDSLHSTAAVDVVKVVTDLGSFTTVATLVFVTGIVLLARRRIAELVALITGSLAIYVAVQLAKNGVDRPRPVEPREATRGSSFPSGHAAYSTIWVGVAIVLSRVVPGAVRDAALLGVAFAIAVAVGLSRVYLRAHYWSDVAGGWALGAGLLGAVGALTLIVAHMRHNAPGDASPGRPPSERA